MRLILIRHGQSLTNAQKTYNRTVDPLTDLGRAQAERVAQHFVAEHIDVIYASTLPRAFDTAEPLARTRGLKIIRDPRIVELDFGTGSTRGIGTRGLILDAEAAGEDFMTFNGHNGETVAALVERARPFFAELIDQHKGQTVAVVAHGGLIRIMLYYLLQLSVEDLLALQHANTAYSIISVDEDGSYRAHVLAEKGHVTDHLD